MPPALLFFFKIILAFWSLICSTCLKAKSRNKLFGIILHWRLVFCPPFIYLFSHLCQYELMVIYFIISVVIQYCFFNFVAQIISVLATGKGTQLAPMSLRYMLSLRGFALLCVFYLLSNSLFSGSIKHSINSRLIFYIFCSNPGISHLSKEITIWGLGVLSVPCQFIITYYSVCKFINLIAITPIKLKYKYKLNVYSYAHISLQSCKPTLFR